MKLQPFYNEYINLKFHRGIEQVPLTDFEFGELEDGETVLFFKKYPEETFINWTYPLQPPDPNYSKNPHLKPVLANVFNQLDVYDEQTLFYLLFTINSTTTISNINGYNKMNDFMKNFAFLQLTQVTKITALSMEQQQQLRDFFWFFYLYAHPVNEETLYSCSFEGLDGSNLVHTKSAVSLKSYFTEYHEYYKNNLLQYNEKIGISKGEIEASKNLSLALLQAIEGKSDPLYLPHDDGLEDILALINDVNLMLDMYHSTKDQLWSIIRSFFQRNDASPYAQYCFDVLLQNIVCYIFYFELEACEEMVKSLQNEPSWCGKIVNKMFGDTIFMQRILWIHQIDLTQYEHIIAYFNEENRSYYLAQS
ncbi:hypothetical protein ABE099_13830 [Paenibacillus turicensis]|uniref:hypothetical protein n=1 Tax=Paenibacillus turicensis TaxID=160487 RepID=UPI003D28D045